MTLTRSRVVCLGTIFTLAGLFVIQGCRHWQTAARELDRVAAHVDEFGTAGVSEPVLVRNTGQFKMEVNRPVVDYINAARANVQGSERSAIIEALNLSAAFQLRADVTGSSELFRRLTFPFTQPTSQASTQPATVPSGPIVALPATTQATTLPAFTPVPGPSTLPSSLTERQLLTIGVNDKATEVLLRSMFDPQQFGPNKLVYFSLLQVSCQPGWRTRRGYVAEVTVTVRYARPARPDEKGRTVVTSDQVPSRQQPLVLSVFPSLEAQTLDLQSNLRSRVTTSLIAAALLQGGPAQAQVNSLLEHARQLERDAATRSAIPVITAHSDGVRFAYQIRPAFQAIGQLAGRKQVAEEILQPVSFPALVVLVLDKGDVAKEKGGDNTTPDAWTQVIYNVSSRWIPADERHAGATLTESRRLRMANRLEKALGELGHAVESPTSGGDGLEAVGYTAQELKRRIVLYESAGIGITRYSELPASQPATQPKTKPTSEPPEIAAVYPEFGWRNADTVLAITGNGFRDSEGGDLVRRVVVGGVECTNVAILGPKTLVAMVPKGSMARTTDDALTEKQVIAVLTDQGVATYSGLTFNRTRAPDTAPASTAPAAASIVRDADGNVTEIRVPRDASLSADKLLDTVKAVVGEEGLSLSREELLQLLEGPAGRGNAGQRK